VLSAEPAGRVGGAAGEPVVAVVTPASALPAPAFHSLSPNSQAYTRGLRRLPEMLDNQPRCLLS
jgi:hypothetical protein